MGKSVADGITVSLVIGLAVGAEEERFQNEEKFPKRGGFMIGRWDMVVVGGGEGSRGVGSPLDDVVHCNQVGFTGGRREKVPQRVTKGRRGDVQSSQPLE